MIKVAYCITRLRRTGPVNVIYNIVNSIDRNEVIPLIITLEEEYENDSRKEDFMKLGIDVICLNRKNKLLRIKKLIKQKKIQILHTHCFRSILLCSLINIPKIVTVHLNFYEEWKVHPKKIFKHLIRIFDFAIKKYDIISPCADWLGDVIREKNHNNNVVPVANGIPNAIENMDIPFELKELKANNKKIYMYVGSIDERKNVKTLTREFSKCSETNEILVCIGDGIYLEDLKKENYTNVLFLGFKSNIADYMKAADYIISLSTSEGLPMAILEGLGLSKPVLLSDIPAHREIVDKRPICGCLSNSVSVLLNFSRNEDYQEIQVNAKEVFDKYFSANIMAKKYEKIYQKILENDI